MQNVNIEQDSEGCATSRSQVTRANHFVPQGLLRRWSLDGNSLYAYDLVVPDRRVPEWSPRSIRSSAVQRDLYTTVEDGVESDTIEKWFTTEIETPGLEASERLTSGKSSTKADWHAIVRLYVLQLTRTPQDYFEQIKRWERDMPELLERTTREALQQLEDARAEGRALEAPAEPNALSDLFRTEIRANQEAETGGVVTTTVTLGRRLWLAGIRHLLEGRAMAQLLGYHWSILRPAPGFEWPITDQPALRLAYEGPQQIGFQAGVGQRRADLMMPLSPTHMLHVEVGKHRPGFHTLSAEHTRVCRSALVRRAFRSVYATRPQPWIARERPRRVDGMQVDYERAGWQRWHDEQTAAEAN